MAGYYSSGTEFDLSIGKLMKPLWKNSINSYLSNASSAYNKSSIRVLGPFLLPVQYYGLKLLYFWHNTYLVFLKPN